MGLCNLDEIKICVDRQYENCHGYSGNKKTIYREAILAVKSILHSAKLIDAVPVVRCRECKFGSWDSETDDAMVCVRTNDGFWRSGNDFCSQGERKEGAE